MNESSRSGPIADILVVDDNLANLKLLTELLNSNGYNARPVASGEKALNAVRSRKPELILLDIKMPGMDGFEVCRRLQADKNTKEIPLLFVSASVETVSIVEGFRLGAVDYITKPVQREEVLARVKTHIELGRKTKQLTEAQTTLEQKVQERTTDLAESEAGFRRLVESSPEILYRYSLQSSGIYYSPRVKEVLNYSPTYLLKHPTLWHDSIHPDDRPKVDKAFEGLKYGDGFDLEYRIRDASGEYQWFHDCSISINQKDNDIIVEGLASDITKYKHSQKELQETCEALQKRESEIKESEEKFRTLFESSNDAIVLLDDDGFFDCNKATLKIFGCSSDKELLGTNPAEWSPPKQPDGRDSRVAEEEHIATAFSEGNNFFEWTHTRANGEEFIAEVLLSPMEINGKQVMQGIIRDITVLKKAEKTLRETEERLRVLINSTPDIICFKDGKGRWLEANNAALELFSLTEVDYCGKTDAELASFTDPLYREAFLTCEKSDAIAWDAKTISQVEEVIPRIDGTKRNFDVIKVPVFEAGGSREGLVVLARDITERKQAEEGRVRLESQLQQAQKMEAIGTLAGGIAHDFNNILSVILGYSEFIAQKTIRGSEIDDFVQQILGATKRASELVKQILTFSRKKETEKQPLHPHFIVKEAMKMLRATLPASISIEEDINPECGTILADPTNIHQIVINLCTNAKQAMADDKGVLRVKLGYTEISHEGMPLDQQVEPGKFVMFRVSDNGCGIDEDTLKKIFEPYFTTKKKGEGTGLGLSVVHGIVHDCNGFIKVTSKVGKGTDVSVYFPSLKNGIEKPESEISPDNQERVEKNKARVLMVDDEPLLVHINKRRLEDAGYQVEAFTDSGKALEAFLNQPDSFDLFITDQTMPDITGEELAKAVLGIKPSLPIILCTGHSDIISKKEAIAIGISKYICKPLKENELLNSVQEVLGKQRPTLS